MTHFLIGVAALLILAAVVILRIRTSVKRWNDDDHHRG